MLANVSGMRLSAALVCFLMLCYAGLIVAQDADTIVLKNDDRKFTLLSQIEDPAEAAAFLTLTQTADPAQRFDLIAKFLKTYPVSWLLPQVYDMAARSAIDLSRYPEALEAGRFSLRLLPENPSLLVLLANVEAQQKVLDRAMEDAGDALEYLEEIGRPPNLSEREWNALKPQLKSSAYFARARAEAARALARTPHDHSELSRTLNDLNEAAAWNDGDAEVFYLRAIVELQLNRKSEAASDLAFVVRNHSALQEKARKILVLLSDRSNSPETFINGLPPRRVDTSLRQEVKRAEYPEILAAGYAGPDACKSCHPNEYRTWQKTGMARMLRPYQPENVVGDFSAGIEYRESDTDVIRMGMDDRPYFDVLYLGKWERFYVSHTIGSKWQQGYATKLPDGRLQVLPIEYNVLQKKWINYWKIIDPPGSPRDVIKDFPKLTVATNYQQNCAICHTSQLKLDPAFSSPMEHATYLQPGIDCEMCHGPAAWHLRQMAKGATGHSDPTEPPFDFRRADNRQGVRVCAQCHRQSNAREIGAGGEMNYSTKGSFVPNTWSMSYDAFSRKAFYKDGRFRETTFIVEAFKRSGCYRRGTAQCATCHSPHVENFETNQTSLKFQKNPNEMCLQCHAGYRNRIAEHSRHRPDSEASQCVSCHMPRIMNAILFKARSHQIEIPSADLTERFGQEESPNVCLTCHSTKGVGWAKEQLSSWMH